MTATAPPLTAPPATERVEVTQIAVDPRPACEIHPEERPSWCLSKEDHAADWEVLYTCGCSMFYCQSSYDSWVLACCVPAGVVCDDHAGPSVSARVSVTVRL